MYAKEVDKQEAEYIIKEMVRAGAVCERDFGHVLEFKFLDLDLRIVNQHDRLLLTTHRPLHVAEIEAYKEAERDQAFAQSSAFVEEYWFNEKVADGDVFFAVGECLSWLAQIRKAKAGPPPPAPTPKPPAEEVIEDRKSGPSWFARFKAWWTGSDIQIDTAGLDKALDIISECRCGSSSLKDDPLLPLANAYDVCKIAADLSAVTGIRPGEALEMIRKAGNFGSQEEIDRLRRENIRLLEKLAAKQLAKSMNERLEE